MQVQYSGYILLGFKVWGFEDHPYNDGEPNGNQMKNDVEARCLKVFSATSTFLLRICNSFCISTMSVF